MIDKNTHGSEEVPSDSDDREKASSDTAISSAEKAVQRIREQQQLSAQFFINDSITRLSHADPSDVQRIAASQLQLLAGYHEIVLAQSRKSFAWALIGAGIGMLFFLLSIFIVFLTNAAANALIPLISGATVEIVAGVVFFLYGKATTQLSSFHGKLENLQRYLLANSICETLVGEDRGKARLSLIEKISQSELDRVERS